MNGVPQPAQDRPLVTFALFAYNQEQYIREAVEGAFLQDYEPLEIILSDDCSSDNTFNIIKDMAAAYDGPHTVRVLSTAHNKGLVLHIMQAVEQASGELIIFAAGDDISKPNRASIMARHWQRSGAWALHSRYDNMEASGHITQKNNRLSNLLSENYSLRKYFFSEDGNVDIVHGVTSAYDRHVFTLLKDSKIGYILSEDGLLSLVINLMKGTVHFIDESLVLYRSHATSITNGPRGARRLSMFQIGNEVEAATRYSRSCANRARFFLDFAKRFEQSNTRRIDFEAVTRDIKMFEISEKWFAMNFIERLSILISKQSNISKSWGAPRLFGRTVFIFFKFLKNRFSLFKFFLNAIADRFNAKVS